MIIKKWRYLALFSKKDTKHNFAYREKTWVAQPCHFQFYYDHHNWSLKSIVKADFVALSEQDAPSKSKVASGKDQGPLLASSNYRFAIKDAHDNALDGPRALEMRENAM